MGGNNGVSVPRPPEVAATYNAVLESVVAVTRVFLPSLPEVAAELVAILHIQGPLSMEELCDALGRSKSRTHGGLRLLEAASMVTRRRDQGARHASFALRGAYPAIVIDAFLGELRRVREENRARLERALAEVGYADGREVNWLLTELERDVPSLLLTALHAAQLGDAGGAQAGERPVPPRE